MIRLLAAALDNPFSIFISALGAVFVILALGEAVKMATANSQPVVESCDCVSE